MARFSYLALLQLAVLSALLALSSGEDCGNDVHVVVIDAGPSKCRLWIYTWAPTENDDSKVPDVHVVSNIKIEPGLSYWVDNEDELKVFIEQIVGYAKHMIPNCSHSSTPIYVLAKEGNIGHDRAERVLEAVYEVLTDESVSPFLVHNRESVRFIAGEDEGVYWWIALNYLTGNLNKESYSDTVGILNLAGDAAQVGYIPEDMFEFIREGYPQEERQANIVNLRIADERYPLFVHSDKDYGEESVQTWIQNYLVKKTPQNATFADPCMIQGQTATADSRFGPNTFLGTSNPTECIEILEELLEKVSGPGQPNLPFEEEFFAVGIYAKVLNNIKAVTDGKTNFATVREKATEFCSKNKEEVEADYPQLPDKYLSRTCTTGLFVSVLLDKGTVNSDKITVREKIDGKTIDWTLGALLRLGYE